jgi:hypothetical protein
MSSDQRTEEQKQAEKLLVNFDADLLSKLFAAKNHQEKVSILGPIAIAMLWDSGQISDAGMNREVHEQYLKLTRKIEERLQGVDLAGLSPEQVEAIAQEKGVRDEVLEAQRIWKEAEEDRILVRQYIEQKQKPQGENHEG